MSNFYSDQGRTRVFGEAYICMLQPETRGERRAGQKGPFMDSNDLGFFDPYQILINRPFPAIDA